MIALLEDQIGDVAKDETSLGENGAFLEKAMNTIILSRKDTFKEKITRAYATKEEELAHYKQRCENLESREQAYETNERQREELALQNLKLKKELGELRTSFHRESSL